MYLGVFIQFANPFPIQEGDSAPLCVNRIGEADVEIAGRLAVDFTSDPVCESISSFDLMITFYHHDLQIF